ncbi:3-keto-5-aminohexanoate cleavage protein [Microbacterium sp. RD1]|uniref:3-keto-5-aminohexanoate cleavage protein n=1 Tax=Microbacterium sp. RD1 TaxID=3457313 RepID=UPI003FA527B9
MKKLILEMRVNEFASRDVNPHIPFTPEELGRVADDCREIGAAMFHFHSRTPTGAPDFSYETYRDVMQRVRAGSDVLIHTSLGAEMQVADPTTRLANVLRLVADGLGPDLIPLDMGSSNFDLLTPDGSDFETTDKVYVNSTGTLKQFAEILREQDIKPYLQIWNAPNLRLAEIFTSMGILDAPVWMTFGMSGGRSFINHPPTPAGLHAYRTLVPEKLSGEWSVTVFADDLFQIAPEVLEHGGHISIGIGDYAYPERGLPTNQELALAVVELAREYGRELATPEEAREMLGMTS